MPLPLSTRCLRPGEAPAELGERARRIGAEALALDASLPADFVAELTARPPLRILAVAAPCPRPRGERVARLASDDRDERRAAVSAALATIELAAAAGAGVVTLRLGRLPVGDWSAATRAFTRGERDDDDGEAELARRVRYVPRALDLCRAGLDPLLGRADALGVTLALENRARWYDLPDDAEIGVLLADFSGAPLRAWLDAAAAHVRALLGWGELAATLAALGPHLAGATLADAAGLTTALPWGLGEVDREAVLAALPAPALRVVLAGPGATDDELAAALAAASA